MAQYGAGSELAAQCPTLPSPDGWRPWIDADGPIPDALMQRAQALADDSAVPLGTTESYPLPGITTLIRIEPRVWSRDATGNLVQGCFRVGGIFLPTAPLDVITTPTVTNTEKIVGVLTAVSLAIGIGATLWGKS